MIQLFDSDTSSPIGTITDNQLRFLINQLEEESSDDQDYYIDTATIDLLEQDGADPTLITLLRTALGSKEGMEIRWSKEG
jgi:processive 1,2-diacylglycerol beta-glucosyltransferase